MNDITFTVVGNVVNDVELRFTKSGEPVAWHLRGWPVPPDWDRYQPVERLGAGGMGVVFKAWDSHLKRHVALKFLKVGTEESTPRFVREAQAQARLDHPRICKVFMRCPPRVPARAGGRS